MKKRERESFLPFHRLRLSGSRDEEGKRGMVFYVARARRKERERYFFFFSSLSFDDEDGKKTALSFLEFIFSFTLYRSCFLHYSSSESSSLSSSRTRK